MELERRTRVAEAQKLLKERRNSVEVQAMLQVLRHQLEVTKDGLIIADSQVGQLQGQARAFQWMINTIVSPSLEELKNG